MSKSRKRRKRKGSSVRFENFLINYGLQTAGILLIAGGLIYFVNSNFNGRILDELWNSLTSSASDKSSLPVSTRTTYSGYLSLLLYIPGILLLGLSHFMREYRTGLKNILLSAGFIWLIVSQGKILLDIRSHAIELNYYLVLVSFGIVQAIATTMAIAGRNRLALIWSVIYFFASVFFIRLIYGVIVPNIILLMLLQVAVSLTCYTYKWRTPFVLLMTLSFVYISYYFIKLVFLPANPGLNLTFILPALLVWFVLSVTGFGILKADSGGKTTAFIWNKLPYATLLVVLLLTMGLYYKAGLNYFSFAAYFLAIITLIIITLLNRKYSFIASGDPFYLSLCLFAAFLFPQLFYAHFFLVLASCLAVAFLISVAFTDLHLSFRLSMGLFFVSLGLYLAEWIITIIPALITQRATGMLYPFQSVSVSILIVALSYAYYKLFTHLIKEYAFAHSQVKKYTGMVSFVYTAILYLSGFLITDYVLLAMLPPGYRFNYIEWGLYSYLFMYSLMLSQNQASRTKLRYVLLASVPAVILYPAVIHPETIHFRTLFLAGNSIAILPFIMHYLGLGVLILILLHINKRLILLYPKSRFFANAQTLSGVLMLSFILLSEYDHLLLLTLNRFSTQPAYEILQYNKFIPYSVIMLLVSVALLLLSLIRYSRFLRRLSMIMILAVLLKVLFIDIAILPANTSIILLISLGAILVALSFLIPRLRKNSTGIKSN